MLSGSKGAFLLELSPLPSYILSVGFDAVNTSHSLPHLLEVSCLFASSVLYSGEWPQPRPPVPQLLLQPSLDRLSNLLTGLAVHTVFSFRMELFISNHPLLIGHFCCSCSVF